MVTFWDTVRGVQLADTLIRELPKLTEKKKQVIITLSDASADNEVTKRFADGFQYKGSYVDSKGITNVILEK